MSLEKTLVILKPSAVQRGLIGEITTRFERKGLRLAGMKMMQLTDELLNEHYAHLSEKTFFQRVKNSMMASPVIVCCYEGVDAIQVVRSMTGATNGRVSILLQTHLYDTPYCILYKGENLIYTENFLLKLVFIPAKILLKLINLILLKDLRQNPTHYTSCSLN